MDSKAAIFSPWSGNAYENDIYRGAVDAIARNVAKLKGSHVIKYSGSEKAEGDHKINRLLQIQPNPYMSAFDMFYKLITHYFLYNNAFAYIEKDDNGRVCGIYPVNALHIEFLNDSQGEIYLMVAKKPYYRIRR